MKIAKPKITGIVLLVGAFFAALLIQFVGPGLVTIDYVKQEVQSADPRLGLTEVVITTFHTWRIIPLLVVASIGIYFIIFSRRHDKPVA